MTPEEMIRIDSKPQGCVFTGGASVENGAFIAYYQRAPQRYAHVVFASGYEAWYEVRIGAAR